MKVRLGLAIASDTIRAVVVNANEIVWHKEESIDDSSEGAISAKVAKVMRDAPVNRWRRPAVVAAVGPSLSQVRRIGGMPAITDPATLGKIVRENTSRFFLQADTRLLTSDIRLLEPGTVLAAAVNESTANAVASGCTAAGFRLAALVPAAVAIGSALEGDDLCWRDGPAAVRVQLHGGKLVALRPIRAQMVVAELRCRPALAAIEGESWRFAAAYGAALFDVNDPLAIRADKGIVGVRRVPWWRIAAALTAAAVALASAASARGIAATRAREKAERARQAVGGDYAIALSQYAEAAHIKDIVDHIAAFEAGRVSATTLMGAFARRLPERTAITALHMDSIGGTIVVIGPSAADAIAALDAMPEVTNPKLVGPITLESMAGERFERATVSFHYARASRFVPSRPDSH